MHIKENRESMLNKVLDRRAPLNIVPIRQDYSHPLAIIGSLKHETPEDLDWYFNHLQAEFCQTGIQVQLILADNTPDRKFIPVLEQFRDATTAQHINSTFLHAPTPGKIHGLNSCLAEVCAPFIISVDLNKKPFPKTLVGLYQRIQTTGLDLLSSRGTDKMVPQPREVPHPSNIGGCYIGKREWFTGFHPGLLDDMQIRALTEARGGNFGAARDLYLYDEKAARLNRKQNLRRKVRWEIGRLQLSHLTVYDKTTEWKLFNPNGEETKINNPDASFTEKLSRLYLENGFKFPYVVFLKALAKAESKIHELEFQMEYSKCLALLLRDPEICTWDNEG